MGEIQNIHIHTIWMIPSDLTEKFKTALKEIDLSRFDFRQIDVQPITSLKNNGSKPSKLSSYTGKFLGFNNQNLEVGEDIMILPRCLNSANIPLDFTVNYDIGISPTS